MFSTTNRQQMHIISMCMINVCVSCIIPIKLSRVVGAEGIVFDPEGNQQVSFKWGLGEATNNQVKELVIHQGLKILDPNWIRELIVLGDSVIITKLFCYSSSSDAHLAKLSRRIQKEPSRFQHIEFFHVLRERNCQADQLANEASFLDCGTLIVKGGASFSPIS
jgi:ribonuclease HI